MTRLQQRWWAVLSGFFPRWRASREWKCTCRTRRTCLGYCEAERRIVEIGRIPDNDDALDALVIHEIAHAVKTGGGGGHGKTWQRRLASAAEVARALKRSRLAELLEAEIVEYRDRAEPVEAAYTSVHDAVFANPDLTWAERWLAREYGQVFSEIEKIFPRLSRVYHESRKEGLEEREV